MATFFTFNMRFKLTNIFQFYGTTLSIDIKFMLPRSDCYEICFVWIRGRFILCITLRHVIHRLDHVTQCTYICRFKLNESYLQPVCSVQPNRFWYRIEKQSQNLFWYKCSRNLPLKSSAFETIQFCCQ